MDAEHAERTQHGYRHGGRGKQTRERLNQIQLEMDRGPARAAATMRSAAPN